VNGVKLTGRRVFIAAGAAVVVVAGAATALAVGRPSPSPSQVASVPADGHTSATLEVISGTRLLTLRVANLGGTSGTLLRASAPKGQPGPRLRTAGANVSLTGGAAAVTVTLNAAVSWRLDLAAGTERTTADLRGGRVAGISVTAGSDVVDLLLPRPGGRVPIRLTGGASQFLLSLPAGVPARVSAEGGAGEVALDGATHVGIGGGSVFTTPGWTAGKAGFDIDATAGAARISVTRYRGMS
jgi:hypothetical protein